MYISCVSGLKQFLQLKVHPCTNIETLTPGPLQFEKRKIENGLNFIFQSQIIKVKEDY